MTKSRFTASSQRTTGDFYKLMNSLGATSLKINQDVYECQMPESKTH